MPPVALRKLTANPARPARYFPGRATAPESESSDEEEEEEEEEEETDEQTEDVAQKQGASAQQKSAKTSTTSKPAPAASSFPSRPAPQSKPPIDEAEFETEESEASGSAEEESGSEEEDSSEDEESSEDDRDRRRRQLLRPTFVKKDERAQVVTLNGAKSNGAYDAQDEADKAQREEERKKERANELVQTQIERNAAARAQGKKFWDDEDVVDEIDDTDDLDPEAEYAAWKLRELTRVKRDRDALIEKEKEIEEAERRRNLTAEEREAEDQAFIDTQNAEKEGKGSMGYMQRYFHKGAFFTDDLKAANLANRDVMGGKYADDVVNRESLPEYMQIRDMAKLGRKGRTRYKDMRSEDTGRFGDFGGRGKKRDDKGLDERFQSDRWAEGRDRERERTGANASVLGERKRGGDDRGGSDGKRPRYD